jgi:hypothetical protein
MVHSVREYYVLIKKEVVKTQREDRKCLLCS